MEIRYLPDYIHYQQMNTAELRESYLIDNLFEVGTLQLIYTDCDRAVIGSAVPTNEKLFLETEEELAANYFTERREIGVINIGMSGSVSVDGRVFPLRNRDGLYIARGSKEITFASKKATNPAAFYLLSYPAHKQFPTTPITKSDAEVVNLGSKEEASERTIYKYIHPAGIRSCQLVMGITELGEGSVWNTMAAHTHIRRTEIYLYFEVKKNHLVFHFMGLPEETRHLVVRNRQAVISPGWSIHSGAGTCNYSFIWGMGGENQAFNDMDPVELERLM